MMVDRFLANRGFKTPGLWSRKKWEWDECYECGERHVYVHEAMTRFGKWRFEWRKFRRMGLKRYRASKEADKRLAEISRMSVGIWSKVLAAQVEKRTFWSEFDAGSKQEVEVTIEEKV